MGEFLVLSLIGLLYVAIILAVLFTFFYTAYKVIKFLPKAEKAMDIIIAANKPAQAHPAVQYEPPTINESTAGQADDHINN